VRSEPRVAITARIAQLGTRWRDPADSRFRIGRSAISRRRLAPRFAISRRGFAVWSAARKAFLMRFTW